MVISDIIIRETWAKYRWAYYELFLELSGSLELFFSSWKNLAVFLVNRADFKIWPPDLRFI